MADPTNARQRTMYSFFRAPRVPIKELPRGEHDAHRERDADDAHQQRTELPGWNAYLGPSA